MTQPIPPAHLQAAAARGKGRPPQPAPPQPGAEGADTPVHVPTAEERAEQLLIPSANCVYADARINWMLITARAGTEPEEYDNNAEPFNLVAHQLTLFDDVRLVDPDYRWVADLIVTDAGPGYAICTLIRPVYLAQRRSDLSDQVPAGYEIVQGKMGEPAWLARRLSDRVVLNAQEFSHTTRDAALSYLKAHPAVRGEVKTKSWA